MRFVTPSLQKLVIRSETAEDSEITQQQSPHPLVFNLLKGAVELKQPPKTGQINRFVLKTSGGGMPLICNGFEL